MKQLLCLLLLTCALYAQVAPKVDFYLVRPFSIEKGRPDIVVEVTNPTDKDFFLSGEFIERPFYKIEVQRSGRWLEYPHFPCPTLSSRYPLRPGTKMLVSMEFPPKEPVVRYRFVFATSETGGPVVSAWTRPIQKSELGDLSALERPEDRKLEFMISMSDEELNRTRRPSELPSHPLAPLHALLRDDLSKREGFTKQHEQFVQQLSETSLIEARETTGEEAFKRIDGTLRSNERFLILTGDLQALRKEAKLTEIHHDGYSGKAGFSAYLSLDGKVLLLWIIPEG